MGFGSEANPLTRPYMTWMILREKVRNNETAPIGGGGGGVVLNRGGAGL